MTGIVTVVTGVVPAALARSAALGGMVPPRHPRGHALLHLLHARL